VVVGRVAPRSGVGLFRLFFIDWDLDPDARIVLPVRDPTAISITWRSTARVPTGRQGIPPGRRNRGGHAEIHDRQHYR
jgi:hypothetical protein